MNINFYLTECTHLRYFIPLVEEANKRNIVSNFFIGRSNKYNCAYLHGEAIKELSKKYKFKIYPLEGLKKTKGYTFYADPHVQKLEASSNEQKIIVLTYMTDFCAKYEKYIDKIDKIVFPSRYFAEYSHTTEVYDKINDKNLYLGSPKYDVVLDKDTILKKYNLSEGKKALVIFPRTRDIHRVDISKIYNTLRGMGFKVLVKTRGKDPAPGIYKGDHYFEDYSWHPHTTMELLEVSDLVVNFDSTVIKECVMLKRPVINFHIKPFDIPLDFLYRHEYCKMFKSSFETEELEAAIDQLINKDLNSEFDMAIEKYLFKRGNVSGKILDQLGLTS